MICDTASRPYISATWSIDLVTLIHTEVNVEIGHGYVLGSRNVRTANRIPAVGPSLQFSGINATTANHRQNHPGLPEYCCLWTTGWTPSRSGVTGTPSGWLLRARFQTFIIFWDGAGLGLLGQGKNSKRSSKPSSGFFNQMSSVSPSLLFAIGRNIHPIARLRYNQQFPPCFAALLGYRQTARTFPSSLRKYCWAISFGRAGLRACNHHG